MVGLDCGRRGLDCSDWRSEWWQQFQEARDNKCGARQGYLRNIGTNYDTTTDHHHRTSAATDYDDDFSTASANHDYGPTGPACSHHDTAAAECSRGSQRLPEH